MLEKIYAIHKKDIHHFELSQPKVLVCLAGAPTSGKSKLAKYLQTKYAATVLSNDHIRRYIDKLAPGTNWDDKQALVHDYLGYFMQKMQDVDNGLVVLDFGIERKYDEVVGLAKQYNYQMLLINFDITDDTLKERVNNLGERSEAYKPELDRWITEHKDFISTHQSDIELKENSNYDQVDEQLNMLLNKDTK